MLSEMEPGAPARSGEVPLCIPFMGGNELEYVTECIRTNFVSSVGPFVTRFERMVADYVGADYAIATVNGTAALHLSLLVAGVGPGDEVVMPSLTFIAPANAVRYAGARPVFLDCERDYWQLDVDAVEVFLRERCVRRGGRVENKTTGMRIAALLPVHILGHPVEMERLGQLAAEFALPVIEDATESLGARCHGKMAGTIGDIGCFSFNGNKLITTGAGGMIVTSRMDLADRARYLSTQAKDDALEYVHHAVGYNHRLSNVLAALGCAQMERIGEHIASKLATAEHYRRALEGVPGVTTMKAASWAESVHWLFTMLIDTDTFGMDSRALMRALRSRGIHTRPLWQPLHQSPAHADSPHEPCPVAERLKREALSLPSSVGITETELRLVTDAIGSLARVPA